MLIYAEDFDTADDILDGRFDELKAALATTAGLPDPDNDSATSGATPAAHQAGYIHFDGEVRQALYEEVVGPDALFPGLPHFDHCDHEEHLS